ncbi:hypothetical protein BCV70DRAFT_111898 [Testicularia cyperi]|uniref:Uncharacterized protein n=1 Tax=Testicularia cyperi TaxID=1882483 RepID=A0A317XMZ4_9BASI|nr:hypothetical protein BCV70DRAFT_111898 [Testicularia cyperi]
MSCMPVLNPLRIRVCNSEPDFLTQILLGIRISPTSSDIIKHGFCVPFPCLLYVRNGSIGATLPCFRPSRLIAAVWIEDRTWPFEYLRRDLHFGDCAIPASNLRPERRPDAYCPAGTRSGYQDGSRTGPRFPTGSTSLKYGRKADVDNLIICAGIQMAPPLRSRMADPKWRAPEGHDARLSRHFLRSTTEGHVR